MKKEKRVLVLATTFPRWENDITPAFVFDLTKRLKGKSFDIKILVPHYPGAKFLEKMDGLIVYRFPYFYPKKFQKLAYEGGIIPNLKKYPWTIIQIPFLFSSEFVFSIIIIKKYDIDLVHSHWVLPSGLVGALCKKLFSVSHITTAHAGDVFIMPNSKFLSSIGKYVLKNSDMVTANSNYTKQILISIDLEIEYKTKIIPMGVDIARFNPIHSIDIKREFNADFLILFVGRLVEKKGVKYLINAMKYIVKKYPMTKLLIGGSGPEIEKLKDIAKKLNLEDNVVFLGYVKNEFLPTLYASVDVFVLPSVETRGGDTEGLGVVLLEAMASGTAVVGSRLGGIVDIIENEKYGMFVKTKDPLDIAQKIILLISNKHIKRNISKEGRKKIINNFSWDVVIEKFANIYRIAKR